MEAGRERLYTCSKCKKDFTYIPRSCQAEVSHQSSQSGGNRSALGLRGDARLSRTWSIALWPTSRMVCTFIFVVRRGAARPPLPSTWPSFWVVRWC